MAVDCVDRRVFLPYIVVNNTMITRPCCNQVRLVNTPLHTRYSLGMLFQCPYLLTAAHVVNGSVAFLVADNDCFPRSIKFDGSHLVLLVNHSELACFGVHVLYVTLLVDQDSETVGPVHYLRANVVFKSIRRCQYSSRLVWQFKWPLP
jgi:hypothetical protein